MKKPIRGQTIICVHCQGVYSTWIARSRKQLIKDGWTIKVKSYTCPHCSLKLKIGKVLMNKIINSLSIAEIFQLFIACTIGIHADKKSTDTRVRKSLQAKKLLTKDGKITAKGRNAVKIMWAEK